MRHLAITALIVSSFACGKAEPASPTAASDAPPAAQAGSPSALTFVERTITLVHQVRMTCAGETVSPPRRYAVPVTLRVPADWVAGKSNDGQPMDGSMGTFVLEPPQNPDDGPHLIVSAAPVMRCDRASFDADFSVSRETFAAEVGREVSRIELVRPGLGVYVMKGKRRAEVTARHWVELPEPITVSYEAFVGADDDTVLGAFADATIGLAVGATKPL
ncbi:MAG: hypothetical protein IT385_21470 [Deltaproteobacteria bacterium]|nr:hypothetical protein [Deltaproteobacteria bacterium]